MVYETTSLNAWGYLLTPRIRSSTVWKSLQKAFVDARPWGAGAAFGSKSHAARVMTMLITPADVDT